jgi:hypothetical protein
MVEAISRRSKILLNLHRDPEAYFEWHRIAWYGLALGTLVLTEEVQPIPGLRAGEHYLVVTQEKMAEMLHWLLHDPAGRHRAATVSQAGQEAWKREYATAPIFNAFIRQPWISRG